MVKFPERPAGQRAIDHDLSDRQVTFRFPGKGLGCLIAWLTLSVFGGGFLVYVLLESGSVGAAAVPALFVGVILLATGQGIVPCQTTIEADPNSIRVTTTRLGRASHQEISADKVRSITRKTSEITIESRVRTISIDGSIYQDEQVEWIRAVLMLILIQ